MSAKTAEDCSLREIDTGLGMGVGVCVIFQPVVGITSQLFSGKSLRLSLSLNFSFHFRADPSPEGKSSYPLTQYPAINLLGSLFPWYLSALGWWHGSPICNRCLILVLQTHRASLLANSRLLPLKDEKLSRWSHAHKKGTSVSHLGLSGSFSLMIPLANL